MSIDEIKKKIGELYLSNNHIPTNDGLQDWYKRTNEYIRAGYDAEEAGRRAAKDVFPNYEERIKIQNEYSKKSHVQSVIILLQQLDNIIDKK